MTLFLQIALVAVGSALGGLLRWGVTLGFARLLGVGFPWGTLFINVSGSFFLGWFSTWLIERGSEDSWARPDHLRLLLAVGFTGAYTTFSTFEYETQSLLSHGHYLKGPAYVAGSVFVGLLAVQLGVWLAKGNPG